MRNAGSKEYSNTLAPRVSHTVCVCVVWLGGWVSVSVCGWVRGCVHVGVCRVCVGGWVSVSVCTCV